ncbi:MAG: hypothetical protein R3F54_14340 [Alphaproteobacteria bacterium]
MQQFVATPQLETPIAFVNDDQADLVVSVAGYIGKAELGICGCRSDNAASGKQQAHRLRTPIIGSKGSKNIKQAGVSMRMSGGDALPQEIGAFGQRPNSALTRFLSADHSSSVHGH